MLQQARLRTLSIIWAACCLRAGFPAHTRCNLIACPFAVIGDWFDALKRYASEPLATAFPTITNDPNELRSYPKGANEVNARTIKPKTKDFDPKKRITGIPGFNFFGSPSSKQEDLF